MLGGLGDGRIDLVPIRFTDEDGWVGGDDGVEVDAHDALDELCDERVAAVNVLAFPAPADARDHVEGEPDVFEGGAEGQAFNLGDVPIKDDHGGNVEWDGRCEKGDVGEADQLAVDRNDIMRCDDG